MGSIHSVTKANNQLMGPPGINKAKQQKKWLIEWRCRLQNGIKSLPDSHLHRKFYNIGGMTKIKQQKLNKKKKTWIPKWA